jgi:hypothetical protein
LANERDQDRIPLCRYLIEGTDVATGSEDQASKSELRGHGMSAGVIGGSPVGCLIASFATDAMPVT